MSERSTSPGDPTQRLRSWRDYPGSRALLTLASFVIVCGGVKLASPILVPVVFAAYLATVTSPLVAWLNRKRMPLGIAVSLVLLGSTVVLAGMAALFGLALSRLTARVPVYVGLVRDATDHVVRWLEGMGASSSLQVIDPGKAVEVVASLAGGVVELLWNLTLALIVAGFLLLRFVRPASAEGPSSVAQTEAFARTVKEMNRYIAIKTLTSMATGLLVGLFAWGMDADLPVLFGLLAFLLNYIPNIGSILAAIPAISLGLLEHGVDYALVMSAGYLVINVGIGNVIEPRIMGRALGLYPIVVLVGVLFWGWLLGVVGALFSSLLTVGVKVLLLGAPDLRAIGLALGPRQPTPPSVPHAETLLDETMPQTQPSPESNPDV